MSAEKNRCNVCNYKGLVVYPARYAVVPKAMEAPGLGPFAGTRVTDVTLTQSQYALRVLRQGFVYLFYEKGKYGKNYWETYSVAPDGSLWKQLDANAARATSEVPSCSRDGHSAYRTRYLVIEKPEKCGTVWMAFSEHKWAQTTRDNYKKLEARKQRMQPIEPSAWVGDTSPGDHAAELNEANLAQLVEYARGVTWDKHGQPANCPFLPTSPISTHKNGNYNKKRLTECSTRYPWAIYGDGRDGRQKQAQQVLTQAKQSGGGHGDTPPDATPMLIALWDGIGITHELNGFRNDPAAWFERYNNERALQVTAMHDIEQTHAILKSRAENRNADELANTQRYAPLSDIDQPLSAQLQQALTESAHPDQTQAYYDDLAWMKKHSAPPFFQRGIQSWAKDTTATKPDADRSYTGEVRDNLMRRAKAKVNERQQKFGDRTDEAEQDWQDYRELLKPGALETFKENYQAIEKATPELQEQRTADITAWLGAPLWLDTLEDYDGTQFADQMAFEYAVNEAVFGLSSTERGKAKIEALAANTTVTDAASILWRVVAMNHPTGRVELTQTLATAKAKREVVLNATNTGEVTGALDQMATLTNLYAGTATKAEKSPTALPKLDKLMMTAGDAMFTLFRVDKLADFVGENILQNIFLARAQVDEADRQHLLETQAQCDQENRAAIRQSAETSQSPHEMEVAAAGATGSQTLKNAWNAVKDSDEGQSYIRSSRIAVVVAIIEAGRIAKLLTEPLDHHAKQQLLASTTGLGAALIQVMATPAYATIKDSSLAMRWRLAGGTLGSVGAFVGVVFDFASGVKSMKETQLGAAALYGLSALGNLGIGTVVIFSAISEAAPLLEKATARFGVRVVLSGATTLSERALALAGARLVGWLTGWEAMIAITALQFLASALTPDPLRVWFARCAFGSGQRDGWFITHVEKPYADTQNQQNAFAGAIEG